MRGLAAAAVLALAAARPCGAATRIAIAVEAGSALKGPVIRQLRAALPDAGPLSISEFDQGRLDDSIQRGLFLAALRNSDIVVAVGRRATELVVKEVEDVPTYFVGGTVVAGERLASPQLAGVFAYSIDDLLDAAKSLSSGRIGLAYTPGYEPFAAAIRGGARSRGLAVADRKISKLHDIPPAVHQLLEESDVLWIVGDPLLARGAGFQYVIERALSKKVPIVAPGRWHVQGGAFLASEAAADVLAREAALAVRALASGEPLPAPRVRLPPSGGSIVYNGALASKWAVRPPPGKEWIVLR